MTPDLIRRETRRAQRNALEAERMARRDSLRRYVICAAIWAALYLIVANLPTS